MDWLGWYFFLLFGATCFLGGFLAGALYVMNRKH